MANFDDYASKAVSEIVFKPYKGLTPDRAVFEKLITALDTKLDVYEKILSKQKYLGGDVSHWFDMCSFAQIMVFCRK